MVWAVTLSKEDALSKTKPLFTTPTPKHIEVDQGCFYNKTDETIKTKNLRGWC